MTKEKSAAMMKASVKEVTEALEVSTEEEARNLDKVNRRYQDSVFVDLFCDDITAKQNDIELYNALHDEHLTDDETEIERVKIEQILYMNFKNDVAFGIRDKVLVFSEHQSTINENMPLRSLLYVGRAYEQIVPVKKRYQKKRVEIPTPEFYTFYTGDEPQPEEVILKLSDAFAKEQGFDFLELKVRVINLRYSEDNLILKKSKTLREYAQFIDCVKRHKKLKNSNDVKRAMELAIKECIRKGILKEYLERKGSQVMNMLIAEYDYEMDIQVQREESYEEGLSQGLSQGLEAGHRSGLSEGQELKLITLVTRKLQKNQSVSQITEDLMEEESKIEEIANAAKNFAPEYDAQKIYEAMREIDKLR